MEIFPGRNVKYPITYMNMSLLLLEKRERKEKERNG
jgi:hypothetical protein